MRHRNFRVFIIFLISLCMLNFSTKAEEPIATMFPADDPDRWHSVYNTGDKNILLGAGTYMAGVDFSSGVYYLESTKSCKQTVKIWAADKTQIHEYDMSDGQKCSVYLNEQMEIEIPAECTMSCIKYKLLIQPGDNIRIIGTRRYFLHYEIPMLVYEITGRRDDSYCIVSKISDETGETTAERIDIPFSKTVTIDLSNTYSDDLFLELHNVYVKCTY